MLTSTVRYQLLYTVSSSDEAVVVVVVASSVVVELSLVVVVVSSEEAVVVVVVLSVVVSFDEVVAVVELPVSELVPSSAAKTPKVEKTPQAAPRAFNAGSVRLPDFSRGGGYYSNFHNEKPPEN